MEENESLEYRRPLQWGEHDPHRRENTLIGMWAWMAQRVSALAIIILLVFHITLTYQPIIQLLLLLAVSFHAALGLRVILLDFNIVGIKYHRALIWVLTALALVLTGYIWRAIY